VTWWRRLLRQGDAENRLDAELRDHLDRLVAENVASGMTPADAARNARLAFGGLEQVKEDCRDVRRTTWLSDIGVDLRFAFRSMARDRWLAATVIVSVALGIGVCTLAFTITDGYFRGGLPVADPDRMLHAATVDSQGREHGVSFADYLDWRRALPDVAMAAYATRPVSIGEAGGASDRVSGVYTTVDLFRLLEVAPMTGRLWGPGDQQTGESSVALLSYRLWTDRFAKDESLPGSTILVNGVSTVVLGVMPEGFGFPSREELWLPLEAGGTGQPHDRSARELAVLARVPRDQRIETAAAAWHAVTANLARVHPSTNSGFDVSLVRFGQHQVGRLSDSPALMLPVTATIILLIACVNIATLLLARAGTRRRELAIRTSVGATRSRIVRQLLTEGFLLAAAGGLAGLGLSTLAVDAIATSFFDGYVPYWMTFSAHGRSFLAVGFFSVISTMLFGLAPAVRASRGASARYVCTGARSGAADRTDPWTARLVAIQFALSVVLLGGAGLLTSSYVALLRVDDVIDASRFTTARLLLEPDMYGTAPHRVEFSERLEAELAAIPGVERIALASTPPFLGASAQSVMLRSREADSLPVAARSVSISPGYFDALGVALIRGRSFHRADDNPSPEVAIVNQLFAERHFPGQDPIGQQIRLRPQAEPESDAADGSPWLTIVGMAPTIRQSAPGGPVPLVYVPLKSAPPLSPVVILRTASASPMHEVRRRIAAIDDRAVLSNVQPLTTTLRNSRLQPQLIATVLGSLGLVGLFLSTVGLYAITAYGVGQRKTEIGLRLALGSRPTQVVWLFMRRGLTPIVAGLGVGLSGAFGVGQLLRGFLIGTSPTNATTFFALSLLLAAVTVGACFFPARRASRLDPASILRQD
jgi:predicted permease